MAQFQITEMMERRGLDPRRVVIAPIFMTEALRKGLQTIHRRLMQPWTRSGSEISALYEQELQRRLVQDNIDDLSVLFGRLDDEVGRLILDLEPAMRQWAINVETWHRTKWASNVLAGTEIDISQVIGPAGGQESIETFMARNTALIRKVSSETRGTISDLVYRGFQNRTGSRAVAKEITRQLGISRRRALRIASDQANKLSAALDRQRSREAGFEFWKWRHSGKLHFRPDHRARNGIIYTDENAPSDLPGQLPFCGCVRQATIITDEAEAAAIRNRKRVSPGAPGVPEGADNVAPPPAARLVETPPPPAPSRRQFRSPIDPEVNAQSIKIETRLAVQRALSKQFAKSAQAAPYQIPKEFRSRGPGDFGKAKFGTGFTDEAVSMIRSLKPELDDLSAQLGIPELRGYKTISGRRTNANMGDGVMGMNPTAFNSFAQQARIGAAGSDEAIEALERAYRQLDAQIQPLTSQAGSLWDEMLAARQAGNPQLFEAIKSTRREILDQHKKLDGQRRKAWGRWQDARNAQMRSSKPAATWKPGDPVSDRPWSAKDYHADGVDKARTLLFHEYGHHVHQYLGKKGHRRQFGIPPLERDLAEYFARADKRKMLSEYGTSNRYEWFAENFATYVMGRVDLMDDVAIELMERIFSGKYP